MLSVPQGGCESHNSNPILLMFCETIWTFQMTLYYPGFPEAQSVVFSVGTHHGLVHRLSVSHPGFIPGLLCGKGVKRRV